MKKKGFSLSEMIITMAIIGFVAILMLPVMNKIQPNQEMVLTRKAYYLTSRIITELINDEDFYPEREDETESGFSNVSIKDQIGNEAIYHGITYGGEGTDFPAEQKFCGLFASKLNLKANVSCASKELDDGGNFETIDGIVWKVPIGDFSKGNTTSAQNIMIDVDGSRGLNCFSSDDNCNKPDRFVFQVDRFGKISVLDEVTQEYISTRNTTKTYSEILEEINKKKNAG